MQSSRTHPTTNRLHSCPRGVMRSVPRIANPSRSRWGRIRRSLGDKGSVAAEFALLAPMILVITAGIVDLGLLTAKMAALAGATRIGAEFARLHPDDTIAIQNAMQNSMNFNPPLTFPAMFPQNCQCDDGTSISCTSSCATAGRPGPNRVFIRIIANQMITLPLSWQGLPTILTSAMEIRVQ